MGEKETYLKTQQVADALNVSVSTIKRWVDSGELKAIRTLGKHRLIPLSDAVAFARRQELPVAGLENLKTTNTTDPSNGQIVLNDAVREGLVDLLKDGRIREAVDRIVEVHRSGVDGVTLADDLIRPVMERVGHSWMVGAWDVYEEHQASLAVATALTRLIGKMPATGGPNAPVAVGATPEGDFYQIPLHLGELVLREAGWDVRNLGSNLPLKSLARAVHDYRPSLVFLSVSHIPDPARFLRDYQNFFEDTSKVGAAVMLGGRALNLDLRARLVYASFGERMSHLAEFARRVRPSSFAPSSNRSGSTSSAPTSTPERDA